MNSKSENVNHMHALIEAHMQDPLKSAIIGWFRNQVAQEKRWGPWSVDQFVAGIGQKSHRVKVALAELTRANLVEKEGNLYSAGSLLQYQISNEMHNAELERLRGLDPGALQKDDPDYLLKAISEAMDRAKAQVNTIVAGPVNLLPGFQVRLAVFRETKLYTATEDFSQQIFALPYDNFVQHITQRILRGAVGRLH